MLSITFFYENECKTAYFILSWQNTFISTTTILFCIYALRLRYLAVALIQQLAEIASFFVSIDTTMSKVLRTFYMAPFETVTSFYRVSETTSLVNLIETNDRQPLSVK